jgi:hypothetical protein
MNQLPFPAQLPPIGSILQTLPAGLPPLSGPLPPLGGPFPPLTGALTPLTGTLPPLTGPLPSLGAPLLPLGDGPPLLPHGEPLPFLLPDQMKLAKLPDPIKLEPEDASAGAGPSRGRGRKQAAVGRHVSPRTFPCWRSHSRHCIPHRLTAQRRGCVPCALPPSTSTTPDHHLTLAGACGGQERGPRAKVR